MNDLSKDLISYFYSEALKYKVYSEDFLSNSKKVSKMYMENFGMTEVWLNYHKILFEDEVQTLKLLEIMYSELVKL
jgi:hypothetical protein